MGFMGSRYPLWKKTMDIAVGAAGFAVLMLIYPAVAVAIKFNSRGPVFVKCERVSKGKKIKVYKFRSMISGAEKLKGSLSSLNERANGPFFKISRDPRVTKVGRFIRKTRIDELPQMINVLKGEMAVVGPRPHEPEEVAEYPEQYVHITEYRAGITGKSQISGASSLDWMEELRLDSEYLKTMSFGEDAKIIAKTFIIFISDHRGV